MTLFIVTSSAAGADSVRFEKPAGAYRKAKEYEANGSHAFITLPDSRKVSALEFERIYLLNDAD